jgi:hypothetical protein
MKIRNAEQGATRKGFQPSRALLRSANMKTCNPSYVIGLGILDFISVAWFVSIFVGPVSGYSPPIAMLLAITGLIGSSIALNRGIAGPSKWLRKVLIVGVIAAAVGLAGALWLGFVLPNVNANA